VATLSRSSCALAAPLAQNKNTHSATKICADTPHLDDISTLMKPFRAANPVKELIFNEQPQLLAYAQFIHIGKYFKPVAYYTLHSKSGAHHL
jgi:hypothetical protein